MAVDEYGRQFTMQDLLTLIRENQKAQDQFEQFVFERPARDRWASLELSARGYAVAKTNYGPLFIRVVSADSYLDGVKIHLEIGNPFAVSFGNAHVTYRYGRRAPPDYLDLPRGQGESEDEWGVRLRAAKTAQDDWEAAVAKTEKQLDWPGELTAGKWTPLELVVAPAKVEETMHLRIAIYLDRVSLTR